MHISFIFNIIQIFTANLYEECHIVILIAYKSRKKNTFLSSIYWYKRTLLSSQSCSQNYWRIMHKIFFKCITPLIHFIGNINLNVKYAILKDASLIIYNFNIKIIWKIAVLTILYSYGLH
ncbi:unnamed protein product [Rhizophagus irregularis]|nr:unnamed protein product [Rhizophagus irregularis]